MDYMIKALQNLGLTEKEARVYLALLQLGQGSAYAVASKAGLKKPTTYVILGELMQKGLALKVPRTRKQLFVAKSPDEFFAAAEERFDAAKSVLPELMAMAQGEKPKVRTFYYEGIHGAREALRYRTEEMKGKELVGFYASPQDASKELIEVFLEWNEKMKGNAVRMIVPDHSSLKHWRATDQKYGRKAKVVPCKEYSANISIDVGDTFVRVLMFRELQAIIIENPDVARTMKQIFEMVWKSRPEKEQGAVEKGE